MKHILVPVLVLATLVGAARPAAAQSAENVLVVVNDASEASRRVADYYAQKRTIPAANVVHLKAPTTDEISRAVFLAKIEGPIAAALSKHSLQDRIFYIVLTKGVPLRIMGTAGRGGTIASVDSELALLYRKMTGVPVPLDGPIANPYYAGSGADVRALFSHAAQDIYLVTRLDGFTVEDATSLVDRSLAATGTAGSIVLDERGGFSDKENDWLAAAADRLRAMHWGERVLLETTNLTAKTDAPALGYFSFGSNDPALSTRAPAVKFAPGALAGMFLSSDARTMTEPPAEWKPAPLGSPYAGSSQSVIGDVVRAGATGAAGQVAEPFLDGAVRPDILFPAYVSGLNLA
ncbi:MAG TPA: TIGR03790 family protein, partial [Vicinamibacterales bacterium]|nr:TIGR03790 family protein [Vicinamibacterales bacterium]